MTSGHGTLDRIAEGMLATALLALAFSLPFEIIRPIFSVGSSFKATNLEILLLLTAFAWALRLAVTRRWPEVQTPLTIPIAVLLIVATLSALLAPSHRAEALKFTGRLAGGAYAFFLVVAAVHDRGRFERLVAAIVGGGLVSAVLGVLEAAGWGMAPPLDLFKAGPTRVGGELRVSASFQYATIASMYFEMVIPFVVAAAVVARRRRTGAGLLAGAALLIEVVVLTLTRAGLVALAAAFLVMGALAWLKRPLRRALVPVGVAAALLVVLLAALAVSNRTVVTRLRTEDERFWYGARYTVPDRLDIAAGAIVTVPVRVENTGAAEWQASGQHPFALSYRWLTAGGESEIAYPGVETRLPRNVAPGESVELAASVRALPQAGSYVLAWGMLQRDITWFRHRGVADAYTRVEVARGAGGQTALPTAPRDETVWVRPPVRRFELWAAAVAMVARHPLLGVGPDNFRHVFGEYAGRSEWDRNVHANNQYLEMFADLGVPGGVTFLALLAIAGLVLLRRWWAAPDDALAPWTLGLAGSFVAFLVHGLLDYFLEFAGLYLLFWMLLGMIVSFPRLGDDGARARSDESA